MSYFVLCGVVYIVLSREARAAFLSPAGLVCIALATITFLPNILWNADQGFVTVEHTAANANWKGNLFNPSKLGEFIVSQFGVFGPLMMGVFVFGLLTARRRMTGTFRRADLFLVCFIVPILVVALGQSFISRANANWAAPAYVSGTVVTVAWMVRAGGTRLLGMSLALHLVAATVTYAMMTSTAAVALFAQENTFKRVRGWEVLAAQVTDASRQAPYAAIMGDDRFLVGELTYYARDAGLPVLMWDADGIPQNHFEAQVPYRATSGTPVLYVSAWDGAFGIRDRFATVDPLGTIEVPRGGGRIDTYYLFRLDGFRAAPAATPEG